MMLPDALLAMCVLWWCCVVLPLGCWWAASMLEDLWHTSQLLVLDSGKDVPGALMSVAAAAADYHSDQGAWRRAAWSSFLQAWGAKPPRPLSLMHGPAAATRVLLVGLEILPLVGGQPQTRQNPRREETPPNLRQRERTC
jgi:hypothetical protein